jgi:kynurenine formamidase
MARLLDLPHTVTAGMVTYRGLPGPVIGDHLTREASRPLRRFFAIPVKVKGMGTFPVRAFAEI